MFIPTFHVASFSLLGAYCLSMGINVFIYYPNLVTFCTIHVYFWSVIIFMPVTANTNFYVFMWKYFSAMTNILLDGFIYGT